MRRFALVLAVASSSALFACSKTDSSDNSSSGGPTDAGGDASEAGAGGDAGGDASCLPPGQSCETTCCAPATCDKTGGAIGTCCLPKGARCTVAMDCCVIPGSTVTCSPGDGGLVCTEKTL